MKNWRTTTAGIITAIIAVAETVLPYLEGTDPINWFQVVGAILFAIATYEAKDKDEPDVVVNPDQSTINPDPKPPRPE